MLILAYHATLAQLVEQLIRNQQVGSSNLLGGSKDSSDTSPGSFSLCLPLYVIPATERESPFIIPEPFCKIFSKNVRLAKHALNN